MPVPYPELPGMQGITRLRPLVDVGDGSRPCLWTRHATWYKRGPCVGRRQASRNPTRGLPYGPMLFTSPSQCPGPRRLGAPQNGIELLHTLGSGKCHCRGNPKPEPALPRLVGAASSWSMWSWLRQGRRWPSVGETRPCVGVRPSRSGGIGKGWCGDPGKHTLRGRFWEDQLAWYAGQ